MEREEHSSAPATAASPRPKRRASRTAAVADERPRGGPARAIADLMPQVGGTAFRRFGFVQSSVVSRWPEIVGERYSRVTAPESIRFPAGRRADGILQLVVIPAHAPLIQHVTPEIIERVNRFFGYQAVSRVKLRQGEVKAPRALEHRTVPGRRAIPCDLGEGLRGIGDPELRAVLEGLASSLAAKEDWTP
ncbi:DUF721 domain-containing protein [Erythrobacteraceae bacterium CFH 75059]|uniref:DUF721 domain-containing protein n=1 Tax=Qipengyuania thermophila TaxID=2509361 RepID=UPI00101F7080|nr:DciA family protein [Qipengyuania thermophila]TCD04881.1 DUF721 domain-containing protein [Erythrobacteraceae bacterium CFH 75059]